MFQSLGSPNPFHMNYGTLKKSRHWGFGGGRSCSLSNGSNIVNNLFRREVQGTLLSRLSNPFGDNGCPVRLRMPIEDIIPASALEAGNIFMGFTNCGRYLLSYTCRPSEHFGASVFDSDASYMYTLHVWLFTPYARIRKVSQVCLFDNNGVYDNNLLIDISQWDKDDNHILITGHSVNPDVDCNHTFYTTVTTIPDAKNCGNCVYMHDEELEDDILSTSRLRTNCILHGLTLHIKYDHVPPYPKFNTDIQLRFKDAVLLNTGNVIHMVSFKLIRPSPVKASVDTVVAPADAASVMCTSKVPLRCDIWLKLPNANLRALTSVKSVSQNSVDNREENIISLNSLDFLLSLFPSSNSITSKSKNETQTVISRRFSQGSTDSELFSPKSYVSCDCGPPMSPPFLNRPRSPRRNNLESGSLIEESGGNLSSKLMLPPQERKFFKRRLSSQSLATSSHILLSSSSAQSDSDMSSFNGQNESKSTELSSAPTTSSGKRKEENKSAFDVFEMRLEDTAVDRHLSSFKTFRKRRLADKKYEFNDAELAAENIVPLKMTRRRSKLSQLQANSSSNPRSPRNENENTSTGNENGNESARGGSSDISHPRSPRAYHVMSPGMSPNYSDSVSDVLRPLNSNLKVKVSALSPNNNNAGVGDGTDLLKPKEDDLKEVKDHSSQISLIDQDIPSHPHEKPTVSIPVNCIAKVMRSFIQKEDDNMSVITDIEDEFCQGYPFPVALPLEVHGAGYQQLHMIRNFKADKFHVPVVQVVQRTLDIEMLCNEIANLICLASDKQFCSCLDFDLAFVDANPDRGTITAIVVTLLQATNLKTKSRNGEKTACNPDLRKKYEVLFVCEWIPNNDHCKILYKSNLQELEVVPDPWHPTLSMEPIIKSHLNVSSTRKALSNALAVHDWQSLDELVDAYGIVTLIKEEGSSKTEDRRLIDHNIVYESNIDLASSASTVTDSDEDWGM